MAAHDGARRRGLPRTPGGAPWPPASSGPAPVAARTATEPADVPGARPAGAAATAERAGAPGVAAPAVTSSRPDVAAPRARTAVRRGLPRPGAVRPAPEQPAPGGSAPPAPPEPAHVPPEPAAAPTAGRRRGLPRPGAAAAASSEPASAAPVSPPVIAGHDERDTGLRPLPFRPAATAGAAGARWQADRARALPTRTPLRAPEPARYGPFTAVQWVGAAVVAAVGIIVAAALVVLITRWFVSVPAVRDFIHTYPGVYDLPPDAPVGIHAWLNWQHFLNIFFMVLIIRTGLTVHYEKRPAAHWSPRGNPARRISLTAWFHQSLDILWIVNGVVFVILLFTSGQWMRIVPTSWDVIPNAVSAGLQYVSLDWPDVDPWTNYNSLQQLAYFATVFLAAPLAALTGVRMSGIWPKRAKALSRVYPVEWARAVHFPVMVYFVLFIIVHVTLVLLEGMRRNLNVMFAARSDATGWVGFWLFVAAMVVVAIGWVAARPLVLAPIARLFGRVSGR